MRGMKHSYVMLALVVLGGALYFSDVDGGFLFLLWPLACFAMMGAMMWGMRGMGKPAPHTHPNGITHAHEEDLTPSGR